MDIILVLILIMIVAIAVAIVAIVYAVQSNGKRIDLEKTVALDKKKWEWATEKWEEVLTNEKDKNAQLNAQIKELEESAKIKRIIYMAAAHQLKAPLSAIKMVSGGEKTSGKRDLFQLILEASTKALNYINRILSSAEEKDGVIHIVVNKFSPWAMLQNLKKELLDSDSFSGYKIVTKIAENNKEQTELCFNSFIGSENLMALALDKLINNAREAIPENENPENKAITIVVESVGEERKSALKFTIHNLGEIPEDLKECFLQKPQESSKERGSGQGAFLASMLVKYQRGKINFTSENNQTTISIEIPTFENPIY